MPPPLPSVASGHARRGGPTSPLAARSPVRSPPSPRSPVTGVGRAMSSNPHQTGSNLRSAAAALMAASQSGQNGRGRAGTTLRLAATLRGGRATGSVRASPAVSPGVSPRGSPAPGRSGGGTPHGTPQALRPKSPTGQSPELALPSLPKAKGALTNTLSPGAAADRRPSARMRSKTSAFNAFNSAGQLSQMGRAAAQGAPPASRDKRGSRVGPGGFFLGGGGQAAGSGDSPAAGFFIPDGSLRGRRAGSRCGSFSSQASTTMDHASSLRLRGALTGIRFAKQVQGQAEGAPSREESEEMERIFTPEEQAARDRKQAIFQKGARIVRSIAQAGIFMRCVGAENKNLGKGRASQLHLPVKRGASRGDDHLAALWSIMEEGRGGPGQSLRGRMALPTAADLSDLPFDLQATFCTLATETLRKYLYPRLLFHQMRKERQRAREKSTIPPMTTDILRRQDMFKDWPPDLLEEVRERVVVASFEKDEFVIHEDEQAGSGIYFVMTGCVEVLKKRSRDVKAIGGDNAIMLVQLQPIICVGEFSFLTEEPRMASIRACSRVDCWVLRKNDFAQFVKQLPSTVFQAVIDVAFATRNKNMHLSYPLSEPALRQCPIFRRCPSAMLQELVQTVTPYAVPRNHSICKGDRPADKIFFLRNGKCGVIRAVQRRIYDRRASETLINTLRAPCVIGDIAVIHDGNYGDTILTMSTCDFWVLSKSSFDILMRRHRGVEALMMAEARSQRQDQLANQQNLFREWIYDIPLLRTLCKRPQMRELVRDFEARVYKPLSVVCSTTAFADRLVVLYKGRIRVGPCSASAPGRSWRKGECAGFTCVVPHRWAQMAVSCGIAECLELPLCVFEEFLRRHGLYRQVVQWVKQLLFPNAFAVEAAEVAMQLVAHLRTPPLYPVSASTRVNLYEEGFSSTHYAHLDYLHKGRISIPPAAEEANAASPTGSRKGKRGWFQPQRGGSPGGQGGLPPLPSAGAHPPGGRTPRRREHNTAAARERDGLQSQPWAKSGALKASGEWTRVSTFLWRRPPMLGRPSVAPERANESLVAELRETGRRRRHGAAACATEAKQDEAGDKEDWRNLI